ncbi:MAG: L-serine ammonia-lyase, iron-sulfur-dependent, subunit alpha [Clostridia bacterium]|nr:L-serine ammonia-lyase, iron-sulfur-dependent, subunit alpha [Clostridia bacterium]
MKHGLDFTNGAELLALCKEHEMTISEAMFSREVSKFGADHEVVWANMEKALDVMRESVRDSQKGDLKLLGGYIGGESKKLLRRIERKGALGGMISRASAYAMGVLELNASMGRIVAAPTAGSSGVLPGVLVAIDEEFEFDDESLVRALFNAGAIGYIISRNATLAGAEGGCQAEVGAASAMAASMVCELLGGSPEMCLAAAGDAISNILGLVCDPVGGLVEYPCQKRNAMGVANAIISAEIALATGGQRLVPFDEVIAAMYNVGRSIPYQLRETALGGLAAAPSVKNIKPGCATCGGCQ